VQITEQQLFDYISCPVKYDIKYNKGINIAEPISMNIILNKIFNFFSINLLNQTVLTPNQLKNKWDSICNLYPNYIDTKKNLTGLDYILRMYNWAKKNEITVLDIDTNYSITVDDIELQGCISAPIIAAPNKSLELLFMNFGNKIPSPYINNMKLIYTLYMYAFKYIYNKEIIGSKIYFVKGDKVFKTTRSKNDFLRLEDTIRGVASGIRNNAFYPRENILCDVCKAKEYCKFWQR